MRYLELKAKERESGYHPTKLKATVCADLMLKLSSATGRYAKVELASKLYVCVKSSHFFSFLIISSSQIMEPILWELLNCVFMDFPSREGHLKGGEESLKTLYGMHTYFDRHREQLELYDDVCNLIAVDMDSSFLIMLIVILFRCRSTTNWKWCSKA